MKIEDFTYGESFHTMLRKYCDTKWSVILWNMINTIIDADADMVKNNRTWRHFATWCEKHWKDNPDLPFYQVAKIWAYSDIEDKPHTGQCHMFEQSILLACDETQDDLNNTMKSLLKD